MEKKEIRIIDLTSNDLEKIIEDKLNNFFGPWMPKPEPKYFTVRELEKLIGCSRPTIYKLKNEGRLSYRRINGTHKIRFTQEDIDNFLNLNPGFREKRQKAG